MKPALIGGLPALIKMFIFVIYILTHVLAIRLIFFPCKLLFPKLRHTCRPLAQRKANYRIQRNCCSFCWCASVLHHLWLKSQPDGMSHDAAHQKGEASANSRKLLCTYLFSCRARFSGAECCKPAYAWEFMSGGCGGGDDGDGACHSNIAWHFESVLAAATAFATFLSCNMIATSITVIIRCKQ